MSFAQLIWKKVFHSVFLLTNSMRDIEARTNSLNRRVDVPFFLKPLEETTCFEINFPEKIARYSFEKSTKKIQSSVNLSLCSVNSL